MATQVDQHFAHPQLSDDDDAEKWNLLQLNVEVCQKKVKQGFLSPPFLHPFPNPFCSTVH